jgi:CRISPR-associated protein Cas1
MDDEKRFWSKVDVKGDDDCWLWRASESAHGYGQFRFKGTVDKAHRVAWVISNGTIPDGMWVLHRCDNRKCCNPKHLRLGEAQDNVGEEIGKERARYNVRDRVESLTTAPTYDPEFVSYEHLMFTEKQDYDASAFKYEKKADLCLRNQNVVVLGGYGLVIKVVNGSLSIEYQRSHTTDKILKLNRGAHKIRNIIVTSHGGFITLGALEWLAQQNITVYLMGWKGNFIQTLTPGQNRNARLCYYQVKASQEELGIEIARELIRQKARKQIETLKILPDHTIAEGRIIFRRGCRVTQKKTVEYGEPVWEQFERGIESVCQLSDVDSIRMLEARLAAAYWSNVAGIPIHWRSSDHKKIPEHWHQITERMSNISTYGNASHATNPFHATLNFAYALLEAQILQAINIAGLEPTVGFLHVKEDGSNLLAYDFMEFFRSAVDAMVLTLFQKTTFQKGDFIQWYTGECRLNEELRRYILAECRVDNTQIDLQCRWLRALLEG